MTASSYVLAALFDRWKFHYSPRRRVASTPDADSSDAASDDDADGVQSFDVNLNTLLECLNIYGNATAPGAARAGGFMHASFEGEQGGAAGGGWRKKRWAGEEDEGHDGEARGGGGGGRDKELRTTGLIMTWKGEGWPLELVLCVLCHAPHCPRVQHAAELLRASQEGRRPGVADDQVQLDPAGARGDALG